MKRALLAILIFISGLSVFGQNYVTQYNGSAYVNCGTSISNSVSLANKITLETRFRMTTSPGSWDSPCGTYHDDSWTTGGFGLYYNGGTQKMNFYIFDYSSNNAAAPFDPNNTSWHHIAGTWEQSTGVISIYIDGVLSGTDNYTGSVGPVTADIFQIGAAHSLYNWKGQLDEVRVWNVVRSQVEIADNMNSQLTGTETGLIAYYKMEEGSGTSLTDNSGHSNTGTMTAGVTWVGAPTISSISPASGTTGTTVTINGNLLTGTTAVTFGGTPATSISVISDAQITAVVGAGTTGNVVVNAPGGSMSYSSFTYATACANPADGGTLAGSQTICAGSVPTAFTSTFSPSGNTGTLEYKWQLSTTSNSDGFSDIASSNSVTYSPGALTATTWYKRLARVSCMADWTGSVASNVVQITVKPIPADQTVSPVSQSICTGASATISIGSSQTSTNYYLRNNSDNTVIDGPKAGTGSSVNFNTGALTSDKAYNVLAIFPKGALAFTGNPGLKKVSLGTTLWTNNFQGTNKATVEAWVYRTATGSLHTIVGNYNGSYPFLFRIDGDKITLFINSSPSVSGATTLAINTWYHVAGTYDGANMKVYVNGVLDGTNAYIGNFISTSNELKIGGGLSNNTEYFPGSISDVRLWNVAKTAEEISASYNLELNGNESGLIALYKMDEGAGSTLGNSATGNLYPGTLVNSPAWVAGPPTTAAVCSLQMTNAPTVTVTPNNTASEASSNPTLCIGTALTAITHTTTGATEIGTATGLPAGVSAAFSSNTITIIGTPTASGTFNYSIPLTGGCGSVNATGTITVNPPSFVPAVRYLSDLTATGENVKWYATASGGTALASTDVLPTGTTHYFASQTVNGVESTTRLDVTAMVDPTPCKPSGAATQTYSSGSTVASLQATGSGIRWYAAESGGAALPTSTALVNGTHYWATQTVNCTESASRLDITAIVN